MRRLRYTNSELDELDLEILRALVDDARLSIKQLATRIGLSSPSVTERVRRLEEAGIIEGYGARINFTAMGLPISVMIRIRPMPGELERVRDLLVAKSEVIECDRVTGDDCFVARAVVPSVTALERLIDDILPYAATNTAIIQSSPVARRMPAFRNHSG